MIGRKALETACREIADIIKPIVSRIFGQRVGFALLVFDYGAKGNLAYVATATRETMLPTLREWLDRQEAGLETDPPGPKVEA